MDKQLIYFKADEQKLVWTGGITEYDGETEAYIEAHFDLGQNWSGFDSVRAVWFNPVNEECISTVLDPDGVCLVPHEVLTAISKIIVNLVGSIVEGELLRARLTTGPIAGFRVKSVPRVDGTETAPVTPSQFDQYVAIVQALVGSVRDIDHISLNPDYTLTIYYSDGTSDTTSSIRGATGNGIASIAKTGSSGTNPKVDTYTITYTDGNTDTFTVTNGLKGDTGATGATGNGIATIAKTSSTVVDGRVVDTYTVTMTNGTTSTFEVTNGKDGDVTLEELLDYTTVQTLDDNEPYQFRRTNAGNGSGHIERLKSIIGASIAWNQLVQNGNFADTSNWNGGKFDLTVSNNEGTFTANNGSAPYKDTTFDLLAGHKYFYTLTAKTPNGIGVRIYYNNGNGIVFINPTSSYATYAGIISNTTAGQGRIRVYADSCQIGDSLTMKNAQLVDLTLALGSTIADYIYTLETGTAGAGVAFLKKYFPCLDEYNAYDAGSIQSVSGLVSHDMVGFNQFDKSTATDGKYINASGNEVNDATRGHSDFIEVFPSTTYYMRGYAGNSYYSVLAYDADKNPLAGFYGGASKTAEFYTTLPSNCRYVILNYMLTQKDTLCFNLRGDGSRDGDFEPYEKHSYPLDPSVTLRGKFNLVDGKLVADGDVYPPSGEGTTNYDEVDLGDYDWTLSDGVFYANIIGKAYLNTDADIVCSKYAVYGTNAVNLADANGRLVDKQICGFKRTSGTSDNSYLYVKDSAYSDAITFKTAMTGQKLVFEKATPSSFSASPYTNPQKCDSSGTEEYVSTSIVPIGHNTDYPMTLIDTMPTANGTYEPRVTVQNGKRTVSWASV